jgi:uncharacterized RDD family membrane protein YckC
LTVAHQLERYPFPVAYPAQLVRTARDPLDRMDKAGHFFEMTATTVGMLALGWCRTHGVELKAVDDWHKTLERKGVALGGWIVLLRGTNAVLTAQPDDPLARALRLTIGNVLPRLDSFTQVRNQHAHGGKPRVRAEVERAARELTELVSVVLDAVEPLTSVRIGAVRACDRPPRARRYDVDLDVMAGYAELFVAERLRSPCGYVPGTVVAYSTGNLQFAADLTPYCRWRSCPTCGRDELFYLTKRRRNRSDHHSFTTGHQLRLNGDNAAGTSRPAVEMRMESLGSRRSEASHGWRASWADLAPRHRRLAARTVDTSLAAAAAAVGGLTGVLLGLPSLWVLLVVILLGAAYEPIAALTGGTLGKRLTRIQPISAWDSRPLNTGDTLRRALVADMQLLLPPVAVYNLAWLFWDPARQCWHDRVAASIVVTGRSRPPQKR